MKYRYSFKCRLCEKKYLGGILDSECKYDKEHIEIMQRDTEECVRHLLATHECDDGSFGVADFTGLVKEGQK